MLPRAPRGMQSWLADRDYRRDLLILVGLFYLGLLFNLLVGVVVVMLFDSFGLWEVALSPMEAQPIFDRT
jgi:hypothetical protein